MDRGAAQDDSEELKIVTVLQSPNEPPSTRNSQNPAQQVVVSSAFERHPLQPPLTPPTTIDTSEGQNSYHSALVVGDNDANSGTTRNLNDSRSDSSTDLTGSVVLKGQEPIAFGALTVIYKGTLRMDGRSIDVAVKAIRTSNDSNNAEIEKRVRRETRIWMNLDHINILPFLGTTMGFGQFPAMVSPWLENGSLTYYLERQGDNLTTMKRLAMLEDVSVGLQYLHSKSVVHGDLSGSNVLINGNRRACISDFGLSTLLTELGRSTWETSDLRAGTLRWTAPELLGLEVPEDEENQPHVPTFQSDVYSFGRIMLQILTGKVPYHDYTREAQVMYAISRGESPKRPSKEMVTNHQWAFMQRCWAPIITERPSGKEIVEFARHELVVTTASGFNDIEGKDVEEKAEDEHPPAPGGPVDTHTGTHPQSPKDEGEHAPTPGSPEGTHRDTHSQGPKDDDEGKNVEEKDEREHAPTPSSPEDTHRDSQGPKDDDEGKNVEEDELPNELSWLGDILKSSAVAPLGGTNETSDPLGVNFFKGVLPTSDTPLPDEVPKKRSAKFRVRSVFTQKRKDGGAENQVQRPPKRAFKFRTMLTRKKKDETQPQPDHQQGAGGAEADIDAQSETTPRELTAKGKGKQKEPNPNPAPARHNGRASTRTAKHQPTTSANQTKREARDRNARVRQAIMRRRDGSTTQAHRLENTTVGDGNSNERDAAGPSRVSRDSSNRRPWITFPRRIRNPEVVEIMEGQMPDRYVSGLKYAKKKRSSSVESGSGSGSGDTENGTEDSVEDEPERRPRNTTPGGLIGVLCFCSCIP